MDYCTGCGRAYLGGDAFCAKCGKPRAGNTTSVQDSTNAPTSSGDGGSSGKSNAVVATGLGILFIGIIPLIFFTVSDFKGDTQGQVVVAGGPRAGFTFRPTGCESMQPYGRFGANIHADGHNDGGLYVTRDPTRGSAVELEIPGSCRNADGTECTVIPLPREQCRTFDTHVEYTGVTVNDVRQVEGYVSVDCTLTDGTTVRGRITFDGC